MGDIQLSDIAALLGNRNDNNGFGGDDGLLLLVIILLFGGWGRGGWGNQGAGGYGAGGVGGNELYPWLNQTEVVNSGFRDQMLNPGITGLQQSVTAGFGGVEQSLCAGFAGVNAGISNGFSQAEIAANARQMADMQQAFNAQVAMMQGFNGVNTGVADLRYTVATEACADRAAVGDALQAVTMQGVQNTNALMSTINGGIQSIKDQLCQDKIDAKNETIAQLRQELMYSRGQASQVEQTAQILANNNAQTALFQQGLNNEVDALYNRLNNCPVPTVPVYGRQPIFQCNNGGCGCGCGNSTF